MSLGTVRVGPEVNKFEQVMLVIWRRGPNVQCPGGVRVGRGLEVRHPGGGKALYSEV